MIEQTPDRARRPLEVVVLSDIIDQLSERHVTVLRQGYDLIGMHFRAMGAMITAPSARSNAADTSLLVDPFDCGRGCNAE